MNRGIATPALIVATQGTLPGSWSASVAENLLEGGLLALLLFVLCIG